MAPWTIGKKITVTCDAGYVVSPPTPPEAAGFRAECVPGDPVWRYRVARWLCSQIFVLYAYGPSGFWTMAPLRCAAKFDPFLSLDCARVEDVGGQSKERKGSNFAIWQP